MKRGYAWLFLLLAAGLIILPTAAALADSVIADNFKYIPTSIAYTGKKVTISGYFVNFNANVTIKKLIDLKVTLYDDYNVAAASTQVMNASNLKSFSLGPLRCKKWTFNISNVDNPGQYSFEDRYRVGFSCSFSYQK